ncbi:uncharacterized protein PG998_011807 [Apiospora kogelbergensis]|uniref:uncharacterized protein n=1 Tax=Apiospora kogelbergensis TaxID=1337665 RepID=UPI00312E02E5
MPPTFSDDYAGDDGEADMFDWSAEREHKDRFFEASRPRNVLCEDLMGPLFAAWARALACMPSLRSALLGFGDGFGRDWGVAYEIPWASGPFGRKGRYRDMTLTERASRRLVFLNTDGWRPRRQWTS